MGVQDNKTKTTNNKKSVHSSSNKTKKTNVTKKEVTKTVNNNSKKSTVRLYFSYGFRLTICLISFVLFFSLCIYFARNIIQKGQFKSIDYVEKGNVDYKVYLNENDFYEEDYLSMNRAYIASLIKYIDVDFKYNFTISEFSEVDFNYKIVGELIIENGNGGKKYLEKEYQLLNFKHERMLNANTFTVDESIKIDYDYYNQIANKFRSTYGIDTRSYLNVYLLVNTASSENVSYVINDTNKILLRIPLSEKTMEISFDQNEKDNTGRIFSKPKDTVSIKILSALVLLFIVTSYFLVKTIRLLMCLKKHFSKYDRYVNKKLKEYDRLIVETHTDVDFSKYNIIEIKTFTELLDTRDNLKTPIFYYNITKHQKGVFYIKEHNDVYLLTIKDIDLKK